MDMKELTRRTRRQGQAIHIRITDDGDKFDGTNVEAALQELTAGGAAAGLHSVDGVSNNGGDVDLIAANTITITPDDANDEITIGETHSALTNNPHSVTFTQAGAIQDAADTVKETHIDWGTGASQVSAVDVPIADAGTHFTGTETETALQEAGAHMDEADPGVAHGNTFASGIAAPTLDTGEGAHELFAMDQDVQTSDSPTFVNGTFTGGVNVGDAVSAAKGDIKSSDGTRTFEWDASTAYLKLNANGVAESRFYMYSDDAGKYLELRSAGSSSLINSVGTPLNIEGTAIAFKAGAVYAIYATSTPRVGINDTSPSYTLDVNGTGRFVDVMRFDEDVILTADKEIYPATHGHGKLGNANHIGEVNAVAGHFHTLDVGDADNTIKVRYHVSAFQGHLFDDAFQEDPGGGTGWWWRLSGVAVYAICPIMVKPGDEILSIGINAHMEHADNILWAQLSYQEDGVGTDVGDPATVTGTSWIEVSSTVNHTVLDKYYHIRILSNAIIDENFVEGVCVVFKKRVL